MGVTVQDVLNVAKLAKLKIPEEDLKKSQDELNAILEFFKKLEAIDTSSVGDSIHPTDGMIERDDVVQKTDLSVIGNAPDTMCNMFAVPKVLG